METNLVEKYVSAVNQIAQLINNIEETMLFDSKQIEYLETTLSNEILKITFTQQELEYFEREDISNMIDELLDKSYLSILKK